ncbi:MAG: AmmeMemoRadiSam system protein B [Crenarchaeota archaeon]|nr:AmmeMemoRadiSam system protein B [Thermoproteota archaeon]
MLVRPPAVAGTFYPADPQELVKLIEWSFLHPIGPGKLPEVSKVRRKASVGYMVPHAGYIYSGPVAAWSYYYLALEGPPETVFLVGPNHTGLGPAISVMPESIWETPLGSVKTDDEVIRELVKISDIIEEDYSAHAYEHSLEVQLPFLQYLFGDSFRIVPIVMKTQTPSASRLLMEAIKEAAESLGRDYVVLSSSDLNHYEPHDITVKKDMIALEKIVELDPEGLQEVLIKYDISMCGPGPVMVNMYLDRSVGARRAELLKHATSGDTSGDKSAVVGYAAVRFPLP